MAASRIDSSLLVSVAVDAGGFFIMGSLKVRSVVFGVCGLLHYMPVLDLCQPLRQDFYD